MGTGVRFGNTRKIYNHVLIKFDYAYVLFKFWLPSPSTLVSIDWLSDEEWMGVGVLFGNTRMI